MVSEYPKLASAILSKPGITAIIEVKSDCAQEVSSPCRILMNILQQVAKSCFLVSVSTCCFSDAESGKYSKLMIPCEALLASLLNIVVLMILPVAVSLKNPFCKLVA